MNRLSNSRTTRYVVSNHDFDFRKSLGQNFLTDEGVILRTLKAADVNKNDVVFEIGPGIGTLTQYLCDAAGSVAAIEIDRKLIPILEETLGDYDNVRIINQDVMKADLCSLAAEYGAGRALGERRLKIVANLPYYITTPILMNIFRQGVPALSVTVMVQKEVADRMTSQPGGKEYGSLSLAVQYYSRAEIIETVPASSFMPRPKVTSAVVKMELYDKKPAQSRDEELLFRIIRAAFEMRRKTLVNALGTSQSTAFGKEQVRNALMRMGKSATVRGEALSLEDFVYLTDLLAQKS